MKIIYYLSLFSFLCLQAKTFLCDYTIFGDSYNFSTLTKLLKENIFEQGIWQTEGIGCPVGGMPQF
jgi:hypothetical protein